MPCFGSFPAKIAETGVYMNLIGKTDAGFIEIS